MSRLKTLSVLAGTFAMLAVSAAPASAIWESNNGQTTGTIKVIATGEYTYSTGGASLRCPNVAEVKAQWQIQGAGQIKEQQKITTKGPHLQLQVKEWGKCEATIGTSKLPATVSECDFQLVQQAGIFTATGGVSKSPCVVKAEPCQIQVPIGMEKTQNSGTGINVGLKTISLSGVGKNQLDKANITEGGEAQGGKGVFSQSTSGNPLCPLAGSSATGTLTGLEFEAEEVKAV